MRIGYERRGSLAQSYYLKQLIMRGGAHLQQSSLYLQLVMRGGAHLENPQYFSSNLKGLTCTI